MSNEFVDVVDVIEMSAQELVYFNLDSFVHGISEIFNLLNKEWFRSFKVFGKLFSFNLLEF
jgi:hypothetical protein